jgi:hypothetical protein
MPIHDEDDDHLFHHSDSPGHDADEHEMTAPDDFSTVPCTRCKKLIFEDTEYCPHCKHYQLDNERNRKPLWFILTAILCIVMLSGIVALMLSGKIQWRM